MCYLADMLLVEDCPLTSMVACKIRRVQHWELELHLLWVLSFLAEDLRQVDLQY